MYYSIKVNSGTKQFSLESSNKSVIQKEMDKYFNYVFNNPINEEDYNDIKITTEEKSGELDEVLGMIFEKNRVPATSLVRKSIISNKRSKEKQESTSKSNVEVMSLKTFLNGYSVDDLVSEFLISAFYIKNVLEKDSFNMKFINSKLFGATGKIADMSVVEELINSSYIKLLKNGDSKEYTITELGEQHIIGRLPIKE